jgi:hypothetical protein
MPILAVEQPRYLSNLEFFFIMKQADVFVLGDTFQYTSHNTINRTQIKTVKGPRWITVPVLSKGRARQRNNEVLIDSHRNWQRNHWKTLEVNYCMTPYFERFYLFFKNAFCSDWKHLVNLNLHFIQYISSKLLVSSRIEFSSKLPNRSDRSQRVIEWLRATNCDVYLVSQKQKPLIDVDMIQKAGFEVRTYQFIAPRYYQQFGNFIPGLSIIDLLCNEGPRSIELLTHAAKIC